MTVVASCAHAVVGHAPSETVPATGGAAHVTIRARDRAGRAARRRTGAGGRRSSPAPGAARVAPSGSGGDTAVGGGLGAFGVIGVWVVHGGDLTSQSSWHRRPRAQQIGSRRDPAGARDAGAQVMTVPALAPPGHYTPPVGEGTICTADVATGRAATLR